MGTSNKLSLIADKHYDYYYFQIYTVDKEVYVEVTTTNRVYGPFDEICTISGLVIYCRYDKVFSFVNYKGEIIGTNNMQYALDNSKVYTKYKGNNKARIDKTVIDYLKYSVTTEFLKHRDFKSSVELSISGYGTSEDTYISFPSSPKMTVQHENVGGKELYIVFITIKNEYKGDGATDKEMEWAWDIQANKWLIEPGQTEMFIGSSTKLGVELSEDIEYMLIEDSSDSNIKRILWTPQYTHVIDRDKVTKANRLYKNIWEYGDSDVGSANILIEIESDGSEKVLAYNKRRNIVINDEYPCNLTIVRDMNDPDVVGIGLKGFKHSGFRLKRLLRLLYIHNEGRILFKEATEGWLEGNLETREIERLAGNDIEKIDSDNSYASTRIWEYKETKYIARRFSGEIYYCVRVE